MSQTKATAFKMPTTNVMPNPSMSLEERKKKEGEKWSTSLRLRLVFLAARKASLYCGEFNYY